MRLNAAPRVGLEEEYLAAAAEGFRGDTPSTFPAWRLQGSAYEREWREEARPSASRRAAAATPSDGAAAAHAAAGRLAASPPVAQCRRPRAPPAGVASRQGRLTAYGRA